jgi:hypothetical protein
MHPCSMNLIINKCVQVLIFENLHRQYLRNCSNSDTVILVTYADSSRNTLYNRNINYLADTTA